MQKDKDAMTTKAKGMMRSIGRRFLMSVVVTGTFMSAMWGMYVLNNGIFGGALSYGILPRVVEFKQIFGWAFSWIFHANYNHLIGNSVVMVSLLPVIGFMERNPFRVLFSLTMLGSLFTWCLGTANTNHIGASGLIFAMIGYIAAASTVGRNWKYLLPLLTSGGLYWLVVTNGLIPKDGVSFSGHFGGLLAGLILGYFISKNQKEESEKMERINSSYKYTPINREKKKWYQFWKNDEPKKIDWSKETQKDLKEAKQRLEDFNKRNPPKKMSR